MMVQARAAQYTTAQLSPAANILGILNLLQMCARCLLSVSSLLNSDSLSALIQRDLKANEHCHNYLQFLKEFSAILVSTYFY